MKTITTPTVLALPAQAPATAEGMELSISRSATRSAYTAPAQNFTGEVSVEMLRTPDGAERASTGSVSFTPGARTAWHSHPLGQTLIVTAGIGRIQRWGGLVQEIRVGDVIHIPPHVKHWHGAAPGTAMTHLAITEVLDGQAAEWMEHVSRAQYEIAPEPASDAVLGAAREVFSTGRP